jgi:GT2 family glycosyltransferase
MVILVARNGSAWLRHCLVALSRQTHPRIGVIAVDNGSTDESGQLLETSLGTDRVVRLDGDGGFPRAVAEALRARDVQEADYLLFLHDDVVLAPDSIARLVEGAERVEGAGVVGPKVLDWDEPGLLREVGMTSDRFGFPHSPLEDGEIDQGQYDRVREVLFVSSCAMLVSKQAWTRIGALDERLDAQGDDLDFCWRARLAGFRVLMTPVAEARHRGASLRGEREVPAHRAPRWRYERERAAMSAILKNYGLVSLLWVLPLYAVQGFGRLVALAVSRRFGDAYQLLAAWGWNVMHLPGTIRRRVRAQRARSVPDREVRRYMAASVDRVRRWAGWTRRSLLSVGSSTEPTEDEEEPELRVPVRHQILRFALAHPAATAWTLGILLALVAYRNLWGASPLSGGQLMAFPSSSSGFFAELLSGLRHPGLGGTLPGSPALGLFGVASMVSFGSAALLEKILLLALPAIAGVTCYRALRTDTGTGPAVVAGATYALSSVVLWGVSEGRIAPLVFLAGLPWLASRLRAAFDPGLGQPRLGWAVGTGLGLAVLVAVYPGTLLAALLITVVAAVMAIGHGTAVRGLVLVLATTAVAALLALPITIGLLGSGGSLLGELIGSPSFGSLARLSLGPAPGAAFTAFYLPIAAALALAFGVGQHARMAAWAAVTGVLAVFLAWAGAAGYLPDPLSNPVVFVGVAAFCFSLIVGHGLSSLAAGVERHAFGIRQVGMAVMALVLGAGLLSQAALAGKGGWSIGGPDRLPLAFPLVGQAPGPAYRVLWLGPWSGGSLPPPAGPSQGRVAAGPASVSYAVTSPSGASVLDLGRPAAGPGYDYLRRALADLLAGDTTHGGALLAPLGVRFVVASPAALPVAATERLAAQYDLDRTAAEGLMVYRNSVAAPLAGVIPQTAWSTASRHPDFGAVASLPAPSRHATLVGNDGALGGEAPSKGLVYLSRQFSSAWRLRSSRTGVDIPPSRAFGWAVGFPASSAQGSFVVRFGGQRARDVLILVVGLLWAAALWITRRPAGG